MKGTTFAAGIFLYATLAIGSAMAAETKQEETTLGDISLMSEDKRDAFIHDYYVPAPACARTWYYEGGGQPLLDKMMRDFAADKSSGLDFYRRLVAADWLMVGSMSYCAHN